eukprot:gene26940-biopygen17515
MKPLIAFVFVLLGRGSLSVKVLGLNGLHRR